MKKITKNVLTVSLTAALGAGCGMPAAVYAADTGTEPAASDMTQTQTDDETSHFTAPDGQASLTKNNIVVFPAGSASGQATLKVKSKKTGALRVQAAGADNMSSVLLRDRKKRPLSGTTDMNVRDKNNALRYVVYGVKAHKTYYLDVNYDSLVSVPDTGMSCGSLVLTNIKATGTGGTSEQKAVLLKKKKTVTGVMTAGSPKEQWYKVTTDRKNTNIRFNISSNHCVKITVYQKAYGKTSRTKFDLDRSEAKKYIASVSAKTPQTYLIRLKPTKKSSGIYTIRWNK